MDIVDTQVHFNQIGLLEAGLAAMAAVGVRSLLFDDFSGKYDEKNRPLPGYELPNSVFRPVCPEAENAATRHPDRFGILRRVDYRDPDLESIAKLMAAAPYVSALRVLALDEPQREAMDKGEFENLFEIASRYDLPAVVLVPGHAGPAEALCREVSGFAPGDRPLRRTAATPRPGRGARPRAEACPLSERNPKNGRMRRSSLPTRHTRSPTPLPCCSARWGLSDRTGSCGAATSR